MRTVPEIKGEMTTAFMANADIKAKYDPNNTWTNTTTFEDVFAIASLESILFYIVAVCAYGIEFLFGTHKAEVAAMEVRMRVGQKEWWRQLCLSFQMGYNLTYDVVTRSFIYAITDETAKLITYCDVRESNNGIVILINESDGNGNPVIIASNTRTAFDAYIKKTKIAGIRLSWNSYNCDLLKIDLHVVFNPLLCNSNGQLYSDSTKPVEIAINNYLANIPFGSGLLNKSAIIDAIQAEECVVDVYPTIPDWLKVSSDYNVNYSAVTTQNLKAFGGSFKTEYITINYEPNV